MAKRKLPQDWSKCIICKADKKEKLQCPAFSKQANRGQGYRSFLENVKSFNELAKDHEQIDLQEITGESDDPVEFLISNEIKWHKSCRLKFSSPMLSRMKERKEAELLNVPSSSASSSENVVSPEARRQSGRVPSSIDRLEKNRNTCMFCSNTTGTLHAVLTKDMDANIRVAATALNDTPLLGFLSEGDLIAQEAHYHKNCHTRYLNRLRALRDAENIESDTSDVETSLAFAEIVCYLEENKEKVHKLSELVKMYQDLRKAEYVHATRLKARLQRVLPEVNCYQAGRDTLISFKTTISSLLEKSQLEKADDDAVALWHAAKIIRRDIEALHLESSDFSLGCQESSVPRSLITLMKLMLVGSAAEDVSHRHQESLSISQLIVANSLLRRRKDASSKRIPAKRETPLPLYVGIYLYSNTRSQKIIDTLYSLGLCVSYRRVVSLSSDIAAAVERRFESDGIVCPVQLKHKLFTTAAVDNIDYNPSSSTSKSSFHGTGVSIFQHPQSDDEGTEREGLSLHEADKNESPCSILSDFTDVQEDVPFGKKPVLPADNYGASIASDGKHLRASLLEENEWLSTLTSADSESQFPTWPAFHAQRHPQNPNPLSVNAMLPLLENSANKISTIKHVMDNLKNMVTFLNPDQIPVLVADQPLFALAKQIQWKWPELYGEKDFVILMGGLHIEMEFLKTMGKLLEGSGWTHALLKAGFCGAGTADSFLKACHVKRTRYAHQVTAASLAILKSEAFTIMQVETICEVDMAEWCGKMKETSHQFFFWDLIMYLELLTMCLVRSFRTGDFHGYLDVLDEILPFLFSLDQTNYARWMSVHLRDMKALPLTAPEIYQKFVEGNFVVKKTQRPFSTMSIDQAHEQNNEKLKGSLNVISLMETPTTLQRWMLAAPHFVDMLAEFESKMPGFKTKQILCHADDSDAKRRRFSADVKSLTDVINVLGNPFLQSSGPALSSLETGLIADTEVTESIRNLQSLGKILCAEFVRERLQDRKQKVTDPMKKNKPKLMSSVKSPGKSKADVKIKELKSTCNLFSQLYIACQRRGGNLNEFFAHENGATPPTLSNIGSLRTSESKADLIPCLVSETKLEDVEAETSPSSTCIIYDGAVIVQLNPPTGSMSFQEYAQTVFMKRVLSTSSHVTRIDVVFDEYHTLSLKSSARQKRGIAGARRVCKETPTPRNWREFLRNDQNKTALFKLLASALIESAKGVTVYATHGPDVLTNTSSADALSPCFQEEADGRIFLHAYDAVRGGHRNLTIRSVDTDVVVLARSMYSKVAAEQLWIAFGSGKNFRHLPIHEIALSLGPEKSNGLLFFHAFTGCDSVSAFHGVGKKKAWTIWQKCPEVNTTFCELSHSPSGVSQHHQQVLEAFTVKLYDSTCRSKSVNEARKILFAQKGRAIERIPPTAHALLQHSKRAAYQAGHIWASCTDKTADIPSPLQWGWKEENHELQPFWTELPDASKVCRELIKCACKKDCLERRCKCLRAALPCTDLCKCGGSCRS